MSAATSSTPSPTLATTPPHNPRQSDLVSMPAPHSQSPAARSSNPPAEEACIARDADAQRPPVPDACNIGPYPSWPGPCTAVHSFGTAGTADSSHTAPQLSGRATFRFDLDRQHERLPFPSLIPFALTNAFPITKIADHGDLPIRRAPRAAYPGIFQLGFQST